ncbi:MAG: hypothetical protein JSU69_07740 [Candidatus Zixiibacteriota bacterium]|nr:MAG: hypothetical protein JSU69_07740 [candidate division Zixibacteria bacterium]
MKKQLIPALIFVFFVGLYVGISQLNDNDYLFLPIWDVEHYLSISEVGYQVYPCTPGVDGRFGDICGNSGWYPMWPLVVRAVRTATGISSRSAFIGLTFLFSFLGFLILFNVVEREHGLGSAALALLALAMGPSSFYLMTGFPYAFFLFIFGLYLLLLYSSAGIKRDILLFVLAVAISLTYPTGVFVAVVPLVWCFGRMKEAGVSLKTVRYWLNLAKYLTPFVLGPLLLWIYFYVKFDDFFLQLHFQEKYDRTWAFPLWIMLKSLAKEPILSPENLSILWSGLIFLVFIPYRLRKEFWILGMVLYLFSLTTGTTMSIYRHYLIIFPAYMIIGASRRPLLLKIGYVGLGLLIALVVLFPKFLAYRLI